MIIEMNVREVNELSNINTILANRGWLTRDQLPKGFPLKVKGPSPSAVGDLENLLLFATVANQEYPELALWDDATHWLRHLLNVGNSGSTDQKVVLRDRLIRTLVFNYVFIMLADGVDTTLWATPEKHFHTLQGIDAENQEVIIKTIPIVAEIIENWYESYQLTH